MKKLLLPLVIGMAIVSCGSKSDPEPPGPKPNPNPANPKDTITDVKPSALMDWGDYETEKKEAMARVDQYRKGDVTLSFELEDGTPLEDVAVKIALKRHDFHWGAADNNLLTSATNHMELRQTFLKYFNTTTPANALKPKQRESDQEVDAEESLLPWCKLNNIAVRGHTMAWEGESYLRPEQKTIYESTTLSDQEKGEQLLASANVHIDHCAEKWDVMCWDVSNEPINNDLINDLLPEMDTHVDHFKQARKMLDKNGRRKVKLFENDYQIITMIQPWALNHKKPGFTQTGRLAIYKEIIRRHIEAGAKVDGIGFQSRIKDGMLTPDLIYSRLCEFDEFNLPYQATEFEIRNNPNGKRYTDTERQLLTEYMMVTYLSHPRVEAFVHWTFCGSADYALFMINGKPNVNGKKWIQMMEGYFNTAFTRAAQGGKLDMLGYFGDYEATAITSGEVKVTGKFSIKKDGADKITVVLR